MEGWDCSRLTQLRRWRSRSWRDLILMSTSISFQGDVESQSCMRHPHAACRLENSEVAERRNFSCKLLTRLPTWLVSFHLHLLSQWKNIEIRTCCPSISSVTDIVDGHTWFWEFQCRISECRCLLLSPRGSYRAVVTLKLSGTWRVRICLREIPAAGRIFSAYLVYYYRYWN